MISIMRILILFLSLDCSCGLSVNIPHVDRRNMLHLAGLSTLSTFSSPVIADDTEVVSPVQVAVEGDAKKVSGLTRYMKQIACLADPLQQLFNEGRALESQGNMAAAQRLYAKVTKISPRVSCHTLKLVNEQLKS